MKRCLCLLSLLSALILASGRPGFAFPSGEQSASAIALPKLTLIDDDRGRGGGRGGRDWGGRGEMRDRGNFREEFDRGGRREGFDHGPLPGALDRGDRREGAERNDPRDISEEHNGSRLDHEEADKPKMRRGIGAGFWGGPYWGYGPRWGHACEACRSSCEDGGDASYCARCRIRCGW